MKDRVTLPERLLEINGLPGMANVEALQRTRCAYFRDEDNASCNKRRPGSACAALHGLNRNHAIFEWSDACVATHSSDVAVALAAMDACRGPRTRGRADDPVHRRCPHARRAGIALPQGARPPILRVRTRVRSRRRGGRGRATGLGQARHGRCGAQTLAALRSRRGVARYRPGRHRRRSAISASFTDAGPLAHNAFNPRCTSGCAPDARSGDRSRHFGFLL